MCNLFQPDSVSQHAESKHPLSVEKILYRKRYTQEQVHYEKKIDDISQILSR